MPKAKKKKPKKGKQEKQGDIGMSSKGVSIVKSYAKPTILGSAGTIAGLLLEDYSRSQGGSYAAYIKELFSEGIRSAAPAIGNFMDEVGKSVVHYATVNPSGTILGSMGVIGAIIVGLKEGYIKNPFAKN